MEGKVEGAVQAGKKSSFPEDMEEKDAMASAVSAAASPSSIFAFLAPPLSLLRHVACLCAGYLGLDGGLKPSAPAPASSSPSASAAAAACRRDEAEAAASGDCTEVVAEVRSRGGFTRPTARSVPVQSKAGQAGGAHH